MKRILTVINAILLTVSAFAQSPEKMSYQAVIRNSNNALVTNTQVGMQVSILQGSVNGTVVYTEMQTPTTNTNGLVSIEIGGGAGFSSIDWANGPYFIKTETDPTGGTTYTITGTSQLLSVPYALHAKTAETLTGGITETDPVFTGSQAANITATDINNLSNLSGVNTGDQDLSALATIIALGDSTAQVRSALGDSIALVQTALGDSIALVRSALGDSLAQVRSEIPDVSGFLTSYSETDPTFIASQAANITATDITNLNNLSGVNTGDQDLSSLATKVALGDSIAQVRSALGDSTAQVLSALGDSTAQVRSALGDSTAQVRSEIPDVSGFLTSYAETDPVYGASIASGISGADTTNWNNKQDRLTAGTNINIVDNVVSAAGSLTTYSVGDFAQGGIVFWVDETGQHGLVAAKVDQDSGNGIRWDHGLYNETDAMGDGVYSGEMNTLLIIANLGVFEGMNSNFYAAGICAKYKVTESGVTYGDWYLPSIHEVDLMYQNKATIDATAVANGGSAFTNTAYWSSTEIDSMSARIRYFNDGSPGLEIKSATKRVRAIRAF